MEIEYEPVCYRINGGFQGNSIFIKFDRNYNQGLHNPADLLSCALLNQSKLLTYLIL